MKKGMMNKRYRRTEEAILEVLLNAKEMPGVGELVRKARISRTTLYRHHRAIPGIVPDYEKEVLGRYRRMMKKILKREEISLKNVYLRMLFFIMKEKRVFEIFFKYEGGRVVEKMVMEVGDLVERTCHLPKNSERMMRIYAKEVAGVIELWGEGGFLEDQIEKVLGEIMYLTETMRERLGPVRD